MKFQNTYITFINLKRSPDRREYMETELKKLGISFEILEATDGQATPVVTPNVNRLTPQELGCADSHLRAMQNFLASPHSFALIMEDDIAIDPFFLNAYELALSYIDSEKPHYVQFDYPPVGIKGIHLWWFLFGNLIQTKRTDMRFWIQLPFYICKGLVANMLSLVEGVGDLIYRKRKASTLYITRKDHYLAGCYLITRETAEILIARNTPIQYAADAVHNIARKQGEITHFIAVPRVIRQRRESFHSTLNDDHFGKKVISY